jgi:hypothetical protein
LFSKRLPPKAGVKVASIFAVVNLVLAPLEVESRGVPCATGLRAPLIADEQRLQHPIQTPSGFGLP